ncbi:hypothetical protein PRLR6025_21980 [Prevotella lacticifex]|nr:hypothetical protein PRLR6025_21980 [Prevotella lacticifex]
MVNGLFVRSEEGTPQGGPLSPLLSNVMLNELGKELERRGLPFVRYADDSMIFLKTRIKNLIKCGINMYNARRWCYVKSYWRGAWTMIMHMAASNVNLRKAGYTFLYDEYVKWLP